MRFKKYKKLIISNLLLLVLLVAGFTYAWFASTYGNIVDADQVQVIADSALEISFNGTDWSSYLNLNSIGSPVDLNNLKFTDITGSGNGSFYKPSLNQLSGYAEVSTSDTWSVPEANTDYIAFDLYMRSTDMVNVYLGEGASVSPQAEKLLNLDDNDTINNKSAYGNFSRDLVAGAVRVSATHTTNEGSGSEAIEHLFTWIPCPKIYFPYGPSENIVSYSGIRIDAASSETFNDISPYQHWYNANPNDATMTKYVGSLVTDTISGENQQKLVSLTTKAGSDTFYQDKVRIYIWLEGCDNEARRAFVDGKFNVSLTLSAQDASQTP